MERKYRFLKYPGHYSVNDLVRSLILKGKGCLQFFPGGKTLQIICHKKLKKSQYINAVKWNEKIY